MSGRCLYKMPVHVHIARNDMTMKLLFIIVISVFQAYVEGSCNIHSGVEHYSCTKYSSVKYSYTVPCGFWHWQRCFRTRYSSTAHQSLCSRKCRVNGAWTAWQAWGSWGSCDQTCGNATRIRYSVRQCNNPAPKNGGAVCSGKNTQKDSELCKTIECPVDGNWGTWQSWSKWGTCNKSCGKGIRTQISQRYCNNPAPRPGGQECQGDGSRQRSEMCVITEFCPVNGGWSTYGPWSQYKECTVTCGGGDKTRYRYRECNNPKPQHGGRSCSGTSMLSHTTPCNTSPCEGNFDEVSLAGNETMHRTNETENESHASKENEFDSTSGFGNSTVTNNTNQTSSDSQTNQGTSSSTITGTPGDGEATTPMTERSTIKENQTEE